MDVVPYCDVRAVSHSCNVFYEYVPKACLGPMAEEKNETTWIELLEFLVSPRARDGANEVDKWERDMWELGDGFLASDLNFSLKQKALGRKIPSEMSCSKKSHLIL